MYGACSASKKSLLFSFPSFMPLPVFTLAASILTSKTPDSAAVDVNVSAASHLSKVPSIGTDAFTANLIVLFTGVILKTGTPDASCAGITGENNELANRVIREIRTQASLQFCSRLL